MAFYTVDARVVALMHDDDRRLLACVGARGVRGAARELGLNPGAVSRRARGVLDRARDPVVLRLVTARGMPERWRSTGLGFFLRGRAAVDVAREQGIPVGEARAHLGAALAWLMGETAGRCGRRSPTPQKGSGFRVQWSSLS